MKPLFLFLFLLTGGHVDKEMNYTASTPADSAVRDFLMISQADSIDFIRWKLKIADLKEFTLSCSYGIGKPNTNGFIDEKKVQLKGTVSFSNGILTLNHHGKSLRAPQSKKYYPAPEYLQWHVKEVFKGSYRD